MWEYVTPYIVISWTKRFVKDRPYGLRNKFRELKYKNRVKKRSMLLMIKAQSEFKSKPYFPKKPQRKNFNSFYRHMQIPF